MYRRWADQVRLACRSAQRLDGRVNPHEGPVALACLFILPIPASWPKKKRAAAELGERCHTSKPDLDNLVKGLKDPLNGVAWVDDRQVVEYREPCAKVYGGADEIGVEVEIWLLPGWPKLHGWVAR